MLEIKIIDGYYGSGKTTYCKEFMKNENHKDYFYYLQIDLLCRNFYGNKKEINKKVLNILYEQILIENKNILIDFYFKSSWNFLLDNIKIFAIENNVKLEYEFLDISLKESYIRYKNRSEFNKNVTFEEYCKRAEIDII